MNILVVPALRGDRIIAGKCPIVIRVYFGRQIAKTVNTGIKIKPEHWDDVLRIVKSGDGNAKIYNRKISINCAELDAKFTQKQILGIPLTPASVKLIAEGKDPGKDFYNFAAEWIKEKYSNKETVKAYLSEITKMQVFRQEVSFGDINLRFLTLYKRHMELLGNQHNTVWKSLKWLRTMVLDAKKMRGYIDENPFDGFKMPRYANPMKKWLTVPQCDDIEKEFVNDNVPVIMKLVAIKFLLMCYSGLRFADAMRFDPELHTIGESHISIKTQKQNTMLNLKYFDRLARVINLIKENPRLKITNRDFNRYLKLIATKCNIKINLTCHVGRHTFGGLLSYMDVPIKKAQMLMAHKDINSTMIYYHVSDNQLDEQMDKLNNL